MSQPPIAVAVGGGHSLDRAALGAFLANLPGLRVIPLESTPPPRVLVWIHGAPPSAEFPCVTSETVVLLVAGELESSTLPPGVGGLFSKDEIAEALGIAIRQVARGEQYLSPSLALAYLRQQKADTPAPETVFNSLTSREREMLALLSEGLGNKAIAARLYLSVRTVEGHLANLYARLAVHSRTEAALLAIQHKPP